MCGPGDLQIEGVEQIELASPGQLTFIGDTRHAAAWSQSRASSALISQGLKADPGPNRALIRVENADLALAEVLNLYAPTVPQPELGIATGATVHPTAKLGRNVAIGDHCYIGPQVQVGDATVLQPNVTVLNGSQIGTGCVVWPGCVIRERCQIGDRCILHPNVTIGADGFGFRPGLDGQGPVKIPQIGTVRIGSEVEIGAGTCIDRGKFSATNIGDRTKIDNLCQIGHNCQVGQGCIIAGHTAIGGSVVIGNAVTIGGRVAIKDHITIGDGASLAGCSSVMQDVPAGESWAGFGFPARPATEAIRKHVAMRKAMRKLPKSTKRFSES